MKFDQEWFNKEYPKAEKEIELKYEDYKESQGQLVIEDYPGLEKLCLMDNKGISSIIIKNLSQLQECEIWGCDVQELVIENCPQIKKLDIENNSLTNLEFLVSLESLEELKLDGNTKLIEILKPYQGDWKAYRIVELAKQKPQELLRMIQNLKKRQNKSSFEETELSQQKYDDLKRFLKGILVSLSQETQKELVIKLDEEIKGEEENIENFSDHSTVTKELKTKNLIFNVGEVIESVKELRGTLEVELAKSKTKIQELEQELKEQTGLYQKKETELSIQQAATKSLLEQLIEKAAEKGKTSDKTEKEKLQREINDLKQKLDEAKEKEYELKGELKGTKTTLKRAEDEVKYLRGLWEKHENQFNETLISQLISHLKEKQLSVQEEQEILNQIKDLLGAKRIFLNTRQITIKGLQNCYNKLKGNKKYTKAEEVGNLISAGGTVAESLTFGVPKAFGETVKLINNSFKRKFSNKCEEEFQELLLNDKDDLSILEDIIINDKILNDKSRETKLFNNKYRVFEIDHSIWENKPFSTAEEMEAIIILLCENLKELRKELEQGEKQFKEFNSNLQQSQQPQILQSPYNIPSSSKK